MEPPDMLLCGLCTKEIPKADSEAEAPMDTSSSHETDSED